MEDTSWLYNPKLCQHSGCVFQAYGMNFEPEAFLQDTTFDPQLILYHGKLSLPEELKRKVTETNLEALQVFETKYLLLTVSEAEQSATQLADATSFLKQYRNEIKRLRELPQVEMITLKFQTPEGGEPPIETFPNEFWELASDVESVMF
ncbi:MAG: hypothetical protein M3367_09630 [Acidobacteriota bacterium]|nr:hypothetical protein [Acidobacteriota bacterium]